MLYETILNFEDNNLDNLKLIYRFIGDTDFTFYKKVLEGMECVSNRIDFDTLSLTPIKNIASVEPTWNIDDSKEVNVTRMIGSCRGRKRRSDIWERTPYCLRQQVSCLSQYLVEQVFFTWSL